MITRKQFQALADASTLGPWMSLPAVSVGDPSKDEDAIVYRALPDAGEKAISVLLVADWATDADVAFVAACREAVPELLRQLELYEEGTNCRTCGDQGHVSRIDGEYLGTCDQCSVYELSCVKHELAQAKAEVERLDEEYDKAWRHDQNDKKNYQVLAAEVARLNAKVEESNGVIDLMARVLAGVSIALKVPDEALHRHSYHDLPELVASLVLENELRKELQQ